VAFERGDVGAHGDIAAILGAPLVDLQPASVDQAHFICAGVSGAMSTVSSSSESRSGGESHDLLVAGPGVVSSDERHAIQEISNCTLQGGSVHPENEGFRYCVDGVAQPYIRGRGLLGERFLLEMSTAIPTRCLPARACLRQAPLARATKTNRRDNS